MRHRLKHFARLRTNCDSGDERPYVALEHVESWTGQLLPGTDLQMVEPAASGMASAEPGDVLFGKLRPYLAKSWLVDRPIYASTELLCLRPCDMLEPRFLAYLMTTNPLVEWASATSDGTRMPRTSWERLGDFRITLPPLEAQVAIVDRLDLEVAHINTLVLNETELIRLLAERRAALITSAIVGTSEAASTAT